MMCVGEPPLLRAKGREFLQAQGKGIQRPEVGDSTVGLGTEKGLMSQEGTVGRSVCGKCERGTRVQ